MKGGVVEFRRGKWVTVNASIYGEDELETVKLLKTMPKNQTLINFWKAFDPSTDVDSGDAIAFTRHLANTIRLRVVADTTMCAEPDKKKCIGHVNYTKLLYSVLQRFHSHIVDNTTNQYTIARATKVDSIYQELVRNSMTQYTANAIAVGILEARQYEQRARSAAEASEIMEAQRQKKATAAAEKEKKNTRKHQQTENARKKVDAYFEEVDLEKERLEEEEAARIAAEALAEQKKAEDAMKAKEAAEEAAKQAAKEAAMKAEEAATQDLLNLYPSSRSRRKPSTSVDETLGIFSAYKGLLSSARKTLVEKNKRLKRYNPSTGDYLDYFRGNAGEDEQKLFDLLRTRTGPLNLERIPHGGSRKRRRIRRKTRRL